MLICHKNMLQIPKSKFRKLGCKMRSTPAFDNNSNNFYSTPTLSFANKARREVNIKSCKKTKNYIKFQKVHISLKHYN